MTKHALQASRLRAPDADAPIIHELLRMHTYARPARGRMVEHFCRIYLDSIPGMRTDATGNRILRIGETPVLWSSHTDTVHTRDGRPRLTYGAGLLTLKPGEKAACLGADCTAGVWVMRQMIFRGVPGLYVFHAMEEIGGYGSQYIAQDTPDLLDGIRWAIALDRRGCDSVITHQGGRRTASDAFARAMAGQLGHGYRPDAGGTFTDTANYADLIPECTNLGVGYHHAHSSSETLDVSHVAWLLERLCGLDFDTMPALRDPAADSLNWWHADDKPDHAAEMTRLCELYPEAAADLLAGYGVTPDEIRDAAAYWRRKG